MIEIGKYLKLIKDAKDKKQIILDFFISLNIDSKDIDFNVENNVLKIKTNSSNRFLLKLNENKVKEFCVKNNLVYNVF